MLQKSRMLALQLRAPAWLPNEYGADLSSSFNSWPPMRVSKGSTSGWVGRQTDRAETLEDEANVPLRDAPRWLLLDLVHRLAFKGLDFVWTDNADIALGLHLTWFSLTSGKQVAFIPMNAPMLDDILMTEVVTTPDRWHSLA